MLPQDSDPRRGRLDPMRRAYPHAEGQEEEPLHLVPEECLHLLRERETPRAIPVGHRPSEGLRRRLERTRPDEAVNGPSPDPSSDGLLSPTTIAGRFGTTLSYIAFENQAGAFHGIRRAWDRPGPCKSSSIRFSRKDAASGTTATLTGS